MHSGIFSSLFAFLKIALLVKGKNKKTYFRERKDDKNFDIGCLNNVQRAVGEKLINLASRSESHISCEQALSLKSLPNSGAGICKNYEIKV